MTQLHGQSTFVRGASTFEQDTGTKFEATGADRFPPKVPTGPDPTGVQVQLLAWNVTPTGGVLKTCGVGFPAMPDGTARTISIPVGQWSNAGKTLIPQFVRLVEKGLFDAKLVVGQTFALDKAKDALQTGILKLS